MLGPAEAGPRRGRGHGVPSQCAHRANAFAALRRLRLAGKIIWAAGPVRPLLANTIIVGKAPISFLDEFRKLSALLIASLALNKELQRETCRVKVGRSVTDPSRPSLLKSRQSAFHLVLATPWWACRQPSVGLLFLEKQIV